MGLKDIMTMRGFAVSAAICMLFNLSACSGSDVQPQPSQTTDNHTSTNTNLGRVAIFTPSDGITLTQHTPINKWAAFTPDLEQSLQKQGFSKDNISKSVNKTLDQQSQQVQDYVVSHVASHPNGDKQKSSDPTTLIIAPAVQSSSIARQYGDYTNQILGLPKQSQSANPDSQPGAADSSSQEQGMKDAYNRLVSSIQLAQENGMHVILLSDYLNETRPDLFVNMSSAEEIGRLQAQQLVSKLELNKADANNPRYIEVLLPKESATVDSSYVAYSRDKDDFAKEAFKGIWQVLSKYFQDGRVISPSGLLTSKSTEADWNKVSFEPGNNTTATTDELERRLRKEKTDTDKEQVKPIDGIIAMNDFISSGVISSLSDMGYTGSSADINPEISIGGIVGSITGKKDVKRQAVPQPKTSSKSETSDKKQSEPKQEPHARRDEPLRWPIVTGYGSYTDNVAHIIDGKQWMTGIEDRKGIASDVAISCRLLNTAQPLAEQTGVTKTQILDKSVLTLSRPLIAVSTSNLKKTLIDTGYIKPADAGL